MRLLGNRQLPTLFVAWLAASGIASADRIELQGGGQLQGVVVPGANPDEVAVQTMTGSKPVVFSKNHVVRVVREPSALDRYFVKRDKTPENAADHYALGLWCETNKLSGLALNHYRHAVELDKSFGPAHKKLGHYERDGRWMTYDELRESQGMVKIKGRWVSQEARERLKVNERDLAAQASWTRRLKIHYNNLTRGGVDDRQDAEERLEEIRDPAAVTPLVRLFGRDTPSMRVRLARILGGIPGPEARRALIAFVLNEPEALVRQEAITELVRRKEIETPNEFLTALADKDPERVGHAALGLAALEAKSAIPKLIPHLVRYQRRTIYVPSGVTMSGGTGGFMTSGIVQPYPVLTGPVVGPGAVAFGSTSVPFVSGSSIGYGGGAAVEAPPIPQTVIDPLPNADVRAALRTLTGQDFGYDIDVWRSWLRTAFRVENAPVRHAPEP